MRVYKSIASCLFGMIFILGVAQAQQITGRIADSSGAIVPKAQVTITNLDTNVVENTVTTGTGDYTVPYLKPGVYSVTASARGFNTETKTNITLQVSQTVHIDFALNVGAVTETINVSGEQLDKDKADVGEVVENDRVNELPLNGGDMGQLAQLSAGAYYSGSILYVRPFDNSVAAMSINGNAYGSNALLLDGVSNEAAHGDAYNGTNSQQGYIPPVQAVQEFKVVTNPYDAVYGRLQGGAIDMTLKSGTNQIHGSVYEFARRAYLDANSWVNDFNRIAKPSHTRDQYGAELDGPIWIPKLYNGRDKTFFLAQFENWSEIFPGTLVDTVPEPQWLQGDFSDLQYYNSSTGTYQPIILYDPLTTKVVNGTPTRQPFPTINGKINQIPTNRLSPYALALFKLYPAPNSAPRPQTTSYTGNYIAPSPTTDTYRNALFKIDQVIGANDRVSLRYGYWERYEFDNQSGIPGEGAYGEYPHGERVNTFTPDWIHTFTSQLIFDFKASLIRRVNILNEGPQNFDLSTLGLSSSQIGQFGTYNNFVPYTNSSEFTAIGNGGGQYTIGNSLAMLPSMNWTKKTHTIHAGLDVRFLQSGWRYQTGGPNFSVDRTWSQANYQSGDPASGNSIASLLLGTASSGTFTINPTLLFSQHYYAPFIQDDWKIRRNLTLNIGVRYDLNQPPTERHNKFDYTFNQSITNPVSANLTAPVKGGLEFPGVDGSPRSYNTLDTATFQPRLGLSWSPWDRLVVHGGFGIFFQNPNPGPNETGFSATTQYDASNDGGVTPTQNLGVPASGTGTNPFPTVIQPTGSSLGAETGLGQGLFYLNPQFATPRTYQYSGGIQQQFGKDSQLEINYSGNRTVNNGTSDNINRQSLLLRAQCDPELGGNPNTCNSPTSAYVANPFYNVNGFQGSNYYTQPTIQQLNLTRPFPQFGDITEYDINGGKTWYNSLQMTASHRVSKSLTVHGTWTWSKEMQSGGYADDYYRIPSRSIYSNDFAHRVTFSGFWLLPVGRGKMLLRNANRWVDEAIGGWELATIVTWQTGFPWTLNGSTDQNGSGYTQRQVTPTTITGVNGACRANWQLVTNPTTNISSYQIVSQGTNKNCGGNYTFVAIPPYGIQPNIVYTGIRDPGTEEWDMSISKSFDVYERLHFQFRLDAFNVPNHPTFSGGYDNSVTDGTFGQITKSSGQSNQPRNVQLTFKLIW